MLKQISTYQAAEQVQYMKTTLLQYIQVITLNNRIACSIGTLSRTQYSIVATSVPSLEDCVPKADCNHV